MSIHWSNTPYYAWERNIYNGNDFWMLFAFPLLGLSYFVSRIAHDYFERNLPDEKKNKDPEPFPTLITGAVIVGGIILLFKIIF